VNRQKISEQTVENRCRLFFMVLVGGFFVNDMNDLKTFHYRPQEKEEERQKVGRRDLKMIYYRVKQNGLNGREECHKLVIKGWIPKQTKLH